MKDQPTIVVVDDDPLMRRVLGEALERMGFAVRLCSGGGEALKALESLKPLTGNFLLVLDYDMPEIDGLEVCRRVRANPDPGLAQTPVILLTAHVGDEAEVQCLQGGADDFVNKPLNLTVLKARIETHLRLAALRTQLQAQNRQLEQWRSLHELDLEAARLIHGAIASREPPVVAGWEFAAYQEPFIQVGGDIFSWLRLPGGELLTWIADATGHGVSAALLTTFTKLLFRYAVFKPRVGGDPGRILRAVNHDFRSTFKGHSFLTAACVVIEPRSGAIRVAAAGHPPVIILRRDGTLDSIAASAPPVGLLPEEVKPRSIRNSLAPGDTLLMVTDGIYTPVDIEGERLSFERFREAMRGYAASSAEAAVRETLTRVRQLAGPEAAFDDDVAVVTIRRKEKGAGRAAVGG